MDKLESYRQIIRDLLAEYASYKSLNPKIEREFVCDRESDRYLIVNFGWHGLRYVHGCSIHMEIRNGKIWIQYNMTDVDFAEELVEKGVPRTDIVLGFQPLDKRPFTRYAVG